MGKAVVGFLAILVTLGGLAVAAGSGIGTTHYTGLAVAVLGILVTFGAIKLHFDEVEKSMPPAGAAATPASASHAAAKPETGTEKENSGTSADTEPPASAQLPPSQEPGQEPFLDPGIKRWLLGAGIGLLGLVGLFLAAGATGGGFAYYGGLALTLLCGLAIFRLIAAATAGKTEAPHPLIPVPGSSMKRWGAGVASGLVTLIALFQAAASGNGPGYHIGMIVVVAALLYIFYLMKVGYDQLEQRH
ncbi:hypothetical protein ACFOW6_10485 [Fodinicurvata halophila]|uniref:Uncharacterized protein n=1 Tax=Fodinicurvata halophila TaxID=1419723 RepID=A0ABV8ULS2_9PROT